MTSQTDSRQYQYHHDCVASAFHQRKGRPVELRAMQRLHLFPILLHCCFVIYWQRPATVREVQARMEASCLQELAVQHQQGVPRSLHLFFQLLEQIDHW